ncbi:armadillo-type protein [Xylogone sp. PMI_703]|nr:armadillo-type protein [Xylogone sp. PMI_703]
MSELNPEDYTVAWFAPLKIEAQVALHMLDNRHWGRFPMDRGDDYVFHAGDMCGHNVIIATLPAGQEYGTGSAAVLASQVKKFFPNLWFGLLVGVAAGLPNFSRRPPRDIRLGDVLVGLPTGDSAGLIAYSLGKETGEDGFQLLLSGDVLARTEAIVRSAISSIKLLAPNDADVIIQYYKNMKHKEHSTGRFTDPGQEHDMLYEVGDDGNKLLVDREKRPDNKRTRVWYGLIGSGDKLTKNAQKRNELRDKYDLIGLEMEAAGTMNRISVGVVRGVCDYGDEHKSNEWRPYAAAMAAAYAKAVLSQIPRKTLLNKPAALQKGASITESERPHVAAYLQEYYGAAQRLQVQRISGELLPMDQCYINLAVVEQLHLAKMNSVRQSSPFSIFTRLKVETVAEDKKVHLSRLFEPRKQPDGTSIIPKRILIRGRAGVGKTTLCKKIVYDYLRHGTWRQLFDLLLWIPLRRLKVGKLPEKYTLVDFFHNLYFYEYEEGKALAIDLSKALIDPIKKNRILFILDGLDEVSKERHSEMPMNNVLLRLLDHPQVIITSRPYGINIDRLQSLDLELETIGFDEVQVEHYIRKIVKCDSKKSDDILNFIQKYVLIQGLVRIPIQLDALCYSWDSNFMSKGEPKTMTMLYQSITQKLWQKDILRLEKSEVKHLNEHTICTLPALQIEDWLPSEINLLESLAFFGLYNDLIEFNANDRHRIYNSPKLQSGDTIIKKSSFLHTSDTTVMDQDRSYHFLHLTFQEFFAARYFVRHWTKHEQLRCIKLGHRTSETLLMTPREFLQREKYNSRYNILWRFAAGLFQGAAEDKNGAEEFLKHYFQELEAEPRDLLGPAHQRALMHCLSEVTLNTESDFNIRVKIEKHILQWLRFECAFLDTVWLCRERECPEYLLKTLVQEESVVVKRHVLSALYERQGMSTEILKALVLLFKGDNAEVRWGAAKALGQQSNLSQDILQDLASLLKDDNADLRWGAAEVLRQQSNLSPDILQAILEVLVLLLKDDNTDLRWRAAEALGQQSNLSQDILQDLASLLKDDNADLRWGAAEVLRQQSNLSQDILQALVLLLRDNNAGVRYAATKALGQQSNLSQDILQALVLLLRDNNADVRYAAAKALVQQSNLSQDILQALVSLLEDNNAAVRWRVAEALGQQSSLSQNILQALVSLLEDDNAAVRYKAAKVLHQQSNLSQDILQNILPVLVLSLKDDNAFVSSGAAKALGQQSNLSQDILQDLASLLKDDNAAVRYKAAKVLHQQSNLSQDILQNILPVLVLSLKDDNAFVRWEAAKALGQHSNLSQDILQALVSLLEDDSTNVRWRAAEALGQQSNLSQNILQALVPLLEDNNADVRWKAAEALRRHNEYYSILPNLSAQNLKSLYGIWLERSFREQESWYLMDNNLYVDTPHGLQIVPLEKHEQEVFRNNIQEAQLSLDIPSCDTRGKSRANI